MLYSLSEGVNGVMFGSSPVMPEEDEMPYKARSVGHGKVRVTSPHGVKAKATTPAKAKRQMNLLRAVEHGWKPTRKK